MALVTTEPYITYLTILYSTLIYRCPLWNYLVTSEASNIIVARPWGGLNFQLNMGVLLCLLFFPHEKFALAPAQSLSHWCARVVTKVFKRNLWIGWSFDTATQISTLTKIGISWLCSFKLSPPSIRRQWCPTFEFPIPAVVSQSITDKSCLICVKNENNTFLVTIRFLGSKRWGEAELHTLQDQERRSQATYTKTSFSVSSPLQCRSQAVVCVSTPRMYPRSGYFLVMK